MPSDPSSKSAKTTHYRTCPLCEATCGLAIEVAGDRVLRVRGDQDDPFSRGFICPKGSTLGELHDDPDRLRAHPRKPHGRPRGRLNGRGNARGRTRTRPSGDMPM